MTYFHTYSRENLRKSSCFAFQSEFCTMGIVDNSHFFTFFARNVEKSRFPIFLHLVFLVRNGVLNRFERVSVRFRHFTFPSSFSPEKVIFHLLFLYSFFRKKEKKRKDGKGERIDGKVRRLVFFQHAHEEFDRADPHDEGGDHTEDRAA